MMHVRLSKVELEKVEARGWRASERALDKTFAFESYGDGIAFAVALGFIAEKRDHHPDLYVTWARVRVIWSTHDAGGSTNTDAELAGETDQLAQTLGARTDVPRIPTPPPPAPGKSTPPGAPGSSK